MLREQAEFVPPAMPGSYIGAKPSQAYKPKPNPYSSLAKAGSRPVKMTQEQMIEAERLLNKEKKEHKVKEPPSKEQIDQARKRIEARVFKIKQEREAEESSIRDDLKAAAKNSTHKRNRSPDDGFQLVGDRRRNVGKVAEVDAEATSSDEDQDLNISEMCSIAKKNAYELHKEEQHRQKKQA